jgi:hypothetical protein
VDHNEDHSAEDISEMLLQTVSVPQIASNSKGKSVHADSAMQKMCISITRTKNASSDSCPNKGRSFLAASLELALDISVSWLSLSNVLDILHYYHILMTLSVKQF